MSTLRNFRHKLLNHDIEHGARRKAQQVRKRRNHKLRSQNRENCTDGFNDARKNAARKRLAPACAFSRKGIDIIAPSGKF